MGNWSGRDYVFLDSEVFITTATLGYNDFHFYCLEGLGNKSSIKNRLLEADTAQRAVCSNIVGRQGSVLEALVRDYLGVYSENGEAKLR